jgi:hypothetical protein
LVTSTDSQESSLENSGGGELDLVSVNAEYCGSKKGELGGSIVLMCGGDEGGIASMSMLRWCVQRLE